jgi:hypothetical protein
MKIEIPVSPGELFDKITILEIKKQKLKQKKNINSVKKELSLMKKTMEALLKENKQAKPLLAKYKSALKSANLKLWNIENSIRAMEAKNNFGDAFIKKAREVYLTNDKRSLLKNRINKVLGSEINEVKEYTRYK